METPSFLPYDDLKSETVAIVFGSPIASISLAQSLKMPVQANQPNGERGGLCLPRMLIASADGVAPETPN